MDGGSHTIANQLAFVLFPYLNVASKFIVIKIACGHGEWAICIRDREKSGREKNILLA